MLCAAPFLVAMSALAREWHVGDVAFLLSDTMGLHGDAENELMRLFRPSKHDTILVYVKDPKGYFFDSEAVDREPYMAPGLVTPEKAARGKLPTDVWWHTIVPTSGREKTGYPTQKPEGILRRIVQASSRPGDIVLDPFAGSGTTGAVAHALGRGAWLIDENPEAIGVMRQRIPAAVVV